MLEVTDVKRSFKSGDFTVNAVSDVSFVVPEGKFVSIVGKSGSGKSTLLSLLGALDKPSTGSIKIDGENIVEMGDHKLVDYRCKTIGFVFQNYNLIPNLTALENVMLPMEYAKTSSKERLSR